MSAASMNKIPVAHAACTAYDVPLIREKISALFRTLRFTPDMFAGKIIIIFDDGYIGGANLGGTRPTDDAATVERGDTDRIIACLGVLGDCSDFGDDSDFV